MLQFVLLASGHADQALAAARLRAIGRHRRSLDVAAPRDGDEHILILNQVFDVELAVHAGQDLCPAVVAILLLQLGQVFLDQIQDLPVVFQQAMQVRDVLGDLAIFIFDLLSLQRGQPAQLHIQNGGGLNFRQSESGHQLCPGIVGVDRRADGLDDFVQVADGDEQPGQDVLAALGLVQLEARATNDHVNPVVDVDLQHPLQREQARLLVHQGQQLHAERRLQGRVLEQLVQDLARLGVALQLDDDRNAVAVRGVAQVGYVVDDPLVHQFGDPLDEQGLVDLERQLRDVDLHAAGAAQIRLDAGHAAHDDAAAAGGIGVANAFTAHDDAACRKIRPLDILHQIVERHLIHSLLPVDEERDGVAQLAQIVGRDVGGHAHGDAG